MQPSVVYYVALFDTFERSAFAATLLYDTVVADILADCFSA